MKKIVLTALVISTMLFSCSKKKDEATLPVGNGTAPVVAAEGDPTFNAKSYEQQIAAIQTSLSPTFTQTSATSGEVKIGDTKLTIEQVGEETYISLPEGEGDNLRLKSKLLTGTGTVGAGEFGGVLISITRSNAKEVFNFFDQAGKKKYGIWGELFGDKTGAVFFSGPDDNFVFKPKLNTVKLPKGFFELSGTITAKATKTIATGKEVTIDGEAGLFAFKATKLAYSDFKSTSFNYFYTTQFSDKDEITTFGQTYKGTANGKFENGFVFIVGLGKGSGTPPMSGILLALTVDGKGNNIKAANLVLGAFGNVKVK
jgi:hypothetical protein